MNICFRHSRINITYTIRNNLQCHVLFCTMHPRTLVNVRVLLLPCKGSRGSDVLENEPHSYLALSNERLVEYK